MKAYAIKTPKGIIQLSSIRVEQAKKEWEKEENIR
jgi:hypothetical protein